MNKYEILKKIGVIIKELQDQYDYTDQNKDEINDLELELFVANAHFLTDHIEILRKLNSQQSKPFRAGRNPVTTTELPVTDQQHLATLQPQFEASYFEPVVQPATTKQDEANHPAITDLTLVNEPLPPVEDFIEPVKEEYAPEAPVKPELYLEEPRPAQQEAHEQLNWQSVELPADEKEPEPVIEPEPTQTVYEQPLTYIPDLAKMPAAIDDATNEQPVVTINEMISAQRLAARTADQAELMPIKDLKSAINLNDKLLFVRDLFNGYSMAYGEAIEILNRFNKFEEADQFLKANYYTKNNWEARQTTADKFYQLLHRRFMS